MKKIVAAFVCSAVAIVALGFVGVKYGPTTYARVFNQWTTETIEADPVGYSKYVQKRLNADLDSYKTTRKDLARATNDLVKMQTEKRDEYEAGNRMAEEFADAIDAGVYPVKMYGSEYKTEAKVRQQLALILAQTDGLNESLQEMDKIGAAAEEENRRIVVQIEKTESQIALLATRREIFKAKRTTSESLALLDRAKTVLDENAAVLEANPVRTISELLKGVNSTADGVQASEVRVEKYLEEYSVKKGGFSKKNAAVVTENIPEEPTANAKAVITVEAEIPEEPEFVEEVEIIEE